MRAIRDWRLEYAIARDIPAFVVLSNRTLENLVRKGPRTLTELEKVYGLGPQKIDAFGKELLDVLREID